MRERTVYRGEFVEIVFGSHGTEPMTPLQAVWCAWGGGGYALSTSEGVIPIHWPAPPAVDLALYENRQFVPDRLACRLRGYDAGRLDLKITADCALIWPLGGQLEDGRARTRTYSAGEFAVVTGTRLVATELGVAWIDSIHERTAVYVPYAMMGPVQASRVDKRHRTRRPSSQI
ncbi:MAG: hypothetical protein K8I27_00790 [Planctomycetes bacterium]|nr:hypothetical protein [Planctomycetota bacterium]